MLDEDLGLLMLTFLSGLGMHLFAPSLPANSVRYCAFQALRIA